MWLRTGDNHLLAIHTTPVSASLGVGVLLLSGGGWIPSTQRNRMYVDLARRLAGHGFDVMRFDYAGVGESTGETRFFDLLSPHTPDVLAAVDTLRARGASRIVLVGTCYGGRMALEAAPEVPDLAAMVISCIPVEDYPGASENLLWHGRRALSRDVWRRLRTKWPKYVRIFRDQLTGLFKRPVGSIGGASRPAGAPPGYVRQLEGALHRNVPVLMLHGRADNHFPQFGSALQHHLGRAIDAHPGLVTLELWEGELHGERTLAAQRYTIDMTEGFLAAWATNQHTPVS